MLKLLPLVFLCGCVTTHNPQPIDTEFNENDRDWIEIYRNEIKIAVENDDIDAYNFFMFEWLKEKIRVKKLNDKKANNIHPQ